MSIFLSEHIGFWLCPIFLFINCCDMLYVSNCCCCSHVCFQSKLWCKVLMYICIFICISVTACWYKYSVRTHVGRKHVRTAKFIAAINLHTNIAGKQTASSWWCCLYIYYIYSMYTSSYTNRCCVGIWFVIILPSLDNGVACCDDWSDNNFSYILAQQHRHTLR